MNLNDELVEKFETAVKNRKEEINKEIIEKLSTRYKDLVDEITKFFNEQMELNDKYELPDNIYAITFIKKFDFKRNFIPSEEEIIKSYRAEHPELKGVRLSPHRRQEIIKEVYGKKLEFNQNQCNNRETIKYEIEKLLEALGFRVIFYENTCKSKMVYQLELIVQLKRNC